MIWIIVCNDKEDLCQEGCHEKKTQRISIDKPHKNPHIRPLTLEDGKKTMKGSFFMVEANDISEIYKFQENDPLFHAEMFGRV